MNRVWETSTAKNSALVVMLALANRADEDGLCWPGVAYIARRARLEERQVQNILRQLAASGELYIAAGGGRSNTNLYFITCGLDAEQIASVLVERLDMLPLDAGSAAASITETVQSSENGAIRVQKRCNSLPETVQPIAPDTYIKQKETNMHASISSAKKPRVASAPKPAEKQRSTNWSEEELALLHAYKEESGVQPIGSDWGRWRKVIREWLERGITPEHVREAVRALQRGKYSYAWPGAVTKTAQGIQLRAQQGRTGARASTSVKDTGLQTNPDGSFYL